MSTPIAAVGLISFKSSPLPDGNCFGLRILLGCTLVKSAGISDENSMNNLDLMSAELQFRVEEL